MEGIQLLVSAMPLLLRLMASSSDTIMKNITAENGSAPIIMT